MTIVATLGAAIGIRRTSLRARLQPGSVRTILASALLTFAAIALYAVATLHGQLAIVSVLSSLYPVAPVLLAYYTLVERVHRVQQLGIAAMLAGVVLLST